MPDREKVIKALENAEVVDGVLKMSNQFRDVLLAMLKEQESLIHFLEHQREKGHWIFGETNGHGWMKCSQCCVSQDGQTSCYLFCPCCGADMTEGR
jgi:hypothetical protein